MKLLWLTDIHLDSASPTSQDMFYQSLREAEFDSAVITGDISIARLLDDHLAELARSCAPRNLYFVLGNHDFYGASFDQVDRMVDACCHKHANLHHLGQGEIVRLGPDSALIGHRGWADGRAYGGRRTARRFPDQDGIRDLRFRSTFFSFRKTEQLGRESGTYFRRVLPYALTSYRNVLIATHVPPFAKAVRFSGQQCDLMSLPHYVNASAGSVILRIGEQFPKTEITVLCGHTHHKATAKIASNIKVVAGRARKGSPAIQDVIEF